MPAGIRATVEFSNADICPLAAVSADAGTTIDSVDANVRSTDDAQSVTEFSLDADHDPEADVTPVFSHGSTRRYRLGHEGVTCPCECLGRFGCPVTRYVASEGTLTLVFHAADYEELRAVVAELRERFPGVDIKRFVRSPAEEGSRDGVLVDRGKLTPRQLEALETAYRMGYFERPRRANATDVADELGITPSTFAEHLAAAETKLLDDIL